MVQDRNMCYDGRPMRNHVTYRMVPFIMTTHNQVKDHSTS